MSRVIEKVRRLSGVLSLPGDKSISHRALLIGAIAEGTTSIENLSDGVDVSRTVACLEQLGTRIKKQNRGRIYSIEGAGLHGLKQPKHLLDAGNSGTTVRLLSGILAGQPFASVLDGDASIRKRPMKRIIEPLRLMGAAVEGAMGDTAPLRIQGGRLQGIDYQLPVASAQVKSCILLAGLYADSRTTVREEAATRDHTERLLAASGAKIALGPGWVELAPGSVLSAQHLFIPGDLSSAAFLIAAGLLIPASQIRIKNVGMNPTRNAFLSVLTDMGAQIEILNVTTVGNELIADLLVSTSSLRAIELRGHTIPALIDELPILAVLASQADGVTEIRDAAELRHKECDRLSALAINLRKMGANVEESQDGLRIEGPATLQAAELESFHDHRIAMAFSIAGLLTEGRTSISGAECIDISYPHFHDHLYGLANV